MNPNYAYITISTGKSYLLGIMAMYLSLKQTGTRFPSTPCYPVTSSRKKKSFAYN